MIHIGKRPIEPSIAEKRRKNTLRENSLESSDENISANFDVSLVKRFVPYVAQYKGPALASLVLMLVYTVLNLANPFLIGIAIDNFITRGDLRGLAIVGVSLLIINVLMWQAQYWQVWSAPAKALVELL